MVIKSVPQSKSFEKTEQRIILDFLVDKGFLTREESILLPSKKVDELIVRTAHEYKNILDEIKGLIKEMRDYLKKFKAESPETLGMILCGSRMDPNKMPALNSDIDTVLILKEGTY